MSENQDRINRIIRGRQRIRMYAYRKGKKASQRLRKDKR